MDIEKLKLKQEIEEEFKDFLKIEKKEISGKGLPHAVPPPMKVGEYTIKTVAISSDVLLHTIITLKKDIAPYSDWREAKSYYGYTYLYTRPGDPVDITKATSHLPALPRYEWPL